MPGRKVAVHLVRRYEPDIQAQLQALTTLLKATPNEKGKASTLEASTHESRGHRVVAEKRLESESPQFAPASDVDVDSEAKSKGNHD